MKKLFGILLVGMLLVAPANAQEDVSFGITVDPMYGYIWRGQELGANVEKQYRTNDKIALQPGIELGFGETGLTVGAWGSWFVQDRGRTEGADEIDLYADFSTMLSEEFGVGISIGFIEYVFPNGATGAKHSEEAYVGVSLDNAIAPALTFYYDFGLTDSWYLALSAGVDLPLGSEDGPALSLGASVAASGDADAYGGKNGFNDLTLTASVALPLGQISITPMVGFAIVEEGVNPNNEVYGGIGIGFSP